ncbi:MAG: Ig-like domain-containing protein [Gemmataceae bacterium]|nr:Ig-like domain-containing protein [Gemmataceae bacterium]
MLGNRVLNVRAPRGVLMSAANPNGGRLQTVLETRPRRGRLVLRANGSFRYTPPRNFAGAVTFSYRISDGLELSDPIVARIVVRRAR